MLADLLFLGLFMLAHSKLITNLTKNNQNKKDLQVCLLGLPGVQFLVAMNLWVLHNTNDQQISLDQWKHEHDMEHHIPCNMVKKLCISTCVGHKPYLHSKYMKK